MEMSAYIDELKLKLTGYVLESEIDDATYTKLVNSAFREVQRYIDSTIYETIPYSTCIDLNPRKINHIARVYRSSGLANSSDVSANGGMLDPMYVAQWQLLSGYGTMYNYQDYVYNYAAYNTALQIRNQVGTDLAFRYDREQNKLYVYQSSGSPGNITIEYIPRFDNVNEIVSDFWIDIILRLSLALAKVTLGRIRSRYTQSGALWSQDGEILLNEGNAELQELRNTLELNTQLTYGID